MEKTKSFYGFTANCTPMQRSKKEEQLSKLFRLCGDSVIYRFADFVIYAMFEKDYKAIAKTITHGYVNGCYGKEWGELTKPKTEYILKSDTDCQFFTINKTMFDYCNYIINTFKTLSEAEKYAENERLEQEKAETEAEEARKRQEQEKEEQKQRKNNHKEWLYAEREKYTNTPIEEMCKAIFEYYYGECNTRGLTPCCDVVILAKDINNPLSRQALIARLHNDNKASIKIFEQFTGIKLPKNYKERIEFLETLQPEQYGEMTEFKPRKKADKTEKKLDKYYKHMRKENKYVEAYGEKITYNNMTFFAEKIEKDKYYTITEATTGMCLTSDKTLTSITKCKEKIKDLCNKMDIAKCISNAIIAGHKSPLYAE